MQGLTCKIRTQRERERERERDSDRDNSEDTNNAEGLSTQTHFAYIHHIHTLYVCMYVCMYVCTLHHT